MPRQPEPSFPSDGQAATPHPWPKRRLVLITLGFVLSGMIGIRWFWPLASPLTNAEQTIVGKWTLPMGPNPPSNAVQQIFWMQPDRKFLFGSRPVGTDEIKYSMAGSWRLDDGQLIMQADQIESVGASVQRLVGNSPRRGRMEDRMRVLGADGKTVRVEAADGSAATLIPVAN